MSWAAALKEMTPLAIGDGTTRPPAAGAAGVDVYVGQVPTTVRQEVLEAIFGPYGATGVRLLSAQGVAFATFQDHAAAQRSIDALNGCKLDQGIAEGLIVKLAETDKPAEQTQPRASLPKVFIGCLNPLATEEHVLQMCQQFGIVAEHKIIRNDNPGKAPCAFVTFSNMQEAELAIAVLNGFQHELATPGKAFNVRLAELEPTSLPKAPPSQDVNESFMGAYAQQVQYLNAQCALYAGANALALPVDDTKNETGIDSPQIFIGGIPEKVGDDFIRGMMAPYGTVNEAWVHKKPGAMACGFARFVHPQSADIAVNTLGRTSRFNIKLSGSGGRDPGLIGTKRPNADWNRDNTPVEVESGQVPAWGGSVGGGTKKKKPLLEDNNAATLGALSNLIDIQVATVGHFEGVWNVTYRGNTDGGTYAISALGDVTVGKKRTVRLVAVGAEDDKRKDQNYMLPGMFLLDGVHREDTWEYVWLKDGKMHIHHFSAYDALHSPLGSPHFWGIGEGMLSWDP